MDGQRDGATDGSEGGAWQGLRFYGRCAGEAWRRSWDVANAWGPIAGVLVLYGAARLGGLDLTVPGPHGAAIGTGLFILVTWLAVFAVQLVAAPPRLCARLDAELRALARRPVPRLAARPLPELAPPEPPVARLPAPEAAPVATVESPPAVTPAAAPVAAVAEPAPRPRPALPPIEVRLHDQVYETDAVDTTGALLPASRAYLARVTNRGETRIRRCQLFFAGPAHIQVVSGPFDLAPGAHRDLPVLRVIDESDEPHALLYFLDSESWAVADGQAAWLPEPGRFKVKLLSANAAEAALEVRLACSAGTPLAWTLVEAAEEAMPKAGGPKPGRRRRAWAADVVAEPGPGD